MPYMGEESPAITSRSCDRETTVHKSIKVAKPTTAFSAGPDRRDQSWPGYIPQLKVHTIPWPLAITDNRILRRTAALLGGPFGPNFSYNGTAKSNTWIGAWATTLTLKFVLFGLRYFAPLHSLALKMMPKPRQGPR